MNILLTGADGYMGWPTLLKMSNAFPDDRIIAIDNMARRDWVEEIGSISALPLQSMEKRLESAFEKGYRNISFINRDLADYEAVKNILDFHRPKIVMHVAAQPSAPYSQLNAELCHYTQTNNINMTRNFLWGLRDLEMTDTHFVETTTTGIYGAPSFEIPEGFIEAKGVDGSTDIIPYPNMASSWYHVTKGFNSTNMRLMNSQTKMPVTDVRTSIVYGADTEETKGIEEFNTRFDFDFYFGTLFNRWCAMAVAGIPLTIYGSGNQIKPFIHLEDAAQSMVDVAKADNKNEFKVYNQLTEYIQIKDLADLILEGAKKHDINASVEFIENPRVEREDKEYKFANKSFLDILSKKDYRNFENSVDSVISRIVPHKDEIADRIDRLIR